MTLPFFWYKNWLELTEADTQNMGQLLLYPMAPFRSANGLALTPPTLTIYAWMTEVKLAGNTGQLAVQSRDEYGTGPVSGVATAVAGFSSKLEDVPIIGKFAKATTLGARAISSIASLFGFTNVPVIDNVGPFKDVPFHGFASSEIGVPMEKLTLDPKNELSIDPTTCGAPGMDELAITNFAKREAWIAEAEWEQTDAVDTLLVGANVTPTHCRTQGAGDELRFLDTPAALATRMFSNWRGDVVYRIKIVKSQYHQGRLLFTFDPTGNGLLGSSPETVVNSEIVDISTTDEVEVRIPYMAPQSFLRAKPEVGRDIWWKGTSVPSYDPDYHNGIFRVTIINPLTGPDASSQVRLLVFMHMENFQLANPSDVAFKSSLFEVQSSDNKCQFTLGQETPPPKELFLVNFGEDVRSLRTIMRRTTAIGADYQSMSGVTTTNLAYIRKLEFYRNIYPEYYGYDPSAYFNITKLVGSGSAPGNAVNDGPANYVTPCFVGVRGSYNYSFDSFLQEDSNFSITRYNEPFTTINSGVIQRMTQPLEYLPKTGLSGMSLVNTKTQSGLQVSVPFMNKFKFIDTSPYSRLKGKAEDDSENNNYIIRATDTFRSPTTGSYTSYNGYFRYGSIGVDYTPIMFVNVPWRHLYDMA